MKDVLRKLCCFIFTLMIFFVLIKCQLDDQTGIEQEILGKIFKDYKNTIRPSDSILGKFYLIPKQIVSLDEKLGIMTSNCLIIAYWSDDRLKWDEVEHNYTTRVLSPLSKVWKPDFFIVNSANSEVFFKHSDNNNVLIESSGWVNLIFTNPSLKTRCKLNIRKFPFDSQVCTIVISSWILDKSKFNFQNDKDSLLNQIYPENPIWELVNVEIKEIESKDRYGYLFSDQTSIETHFQFYLKRKPLYFMINAIFPCLILNVLTLLGFGLPVAQQFAISTNSLLENKIYFLN
jgi:hypothetical protein